MKNDRIYASPSALEAMQSRFALRVAARLNEQTQELAPDIGERLRFAREQAVERARLAQQASRAESRVGVTAAGAALLGGGSGGSGWWIKVASTLPLIVLVAGLLMIQRWHLNEQISTAAEIDTALLGDDLPPTAYSDAGFVEFLKVPRD